jgi:hypothetical protein
MSLDLFAMCFGLSVGLVSVLATVVGCIFSFLAYTKVVGMEKSTHKIQWMPMDQGLTGTELGKKLYDSELEFEDDEHV